MGKIWALHHDKNCPKSVQNCPKMYQKSVVKYYLTTQKIEICTILEMSKKAKTPLLTPLLSK